ncbi:MAG: thioredoxin family protein [Alistipes sp.]|nr:thioredoxin family protein [Alistipes sp.]MBQ3249213.1 thioredoxin family protein [Alistipes sp.]
MVLALALMLPLAAFAQEAASEKTTLKVGGNADSPNAEWTITAEETEEDGVYSITFDGVIKEGYHGYAMKDMFSAPQIEFENNEVVGDVVEPLECEEHADEFGVSYIYHNQAVYVLKIKASEGENVEGYINATICTDEGNQCTSNIAEFTIAMPGVAAVEAAEPTAEGGNLDWSSIIQAILWGFAALLTPCVFPMVPMTVSFFVKGSQSPAQGRFRAFMYGFFIVALYVLPIAVLVLLSNAFGTNVAGDIFNAIGTHWIPNLIFFVIFMVFAASFLGAFEITLPSSLVNKSDAGADKGGLIGIFFMALTLVLVSFSCTGPIVGSVIISSTSGGVWMPIITMTAFAVAFALPFTVLAWFPSLLKNLPKSGGWLNSVKVVLGFIEVALGLKFLMTADQTMHWGLLDRETYLAIWIVVFSLLGFYLLGKIRFAHDDKVEHVSVFRLTLAIGVFSFVVYMIPGMWGAPLNAISGYIPPMSTQDYQVNGRVENVNAGKKYADFLHLPHQLEGHFDFEEAVEEAKRQNKPIFVDVTGHACNNCREMETMVWSNDRVLPMLRDDFVICALYVDDMTKIEGGKRLGSVNAAFAQERWGVNAQPGYILLAPDGETVLAGPRGYDTDIDKFVEFLNKAL